MYMIWRDFCAVPDYEVMDMETMLKRVVELGPKEQSFKVFKLEKVAEFSTETLTALTKNT